MWRLILIAKSFVGIIVFDFSQLHKKGSTCAEEGIKLRGEMWLAECDTVNAWWSWGMNLCILIPNPGYQEVLRMW